MQEQEIWKDVKGYEGYYQVSNLGRVKSLDRIIKIFTPFKRTNKIKGVIIKQQINKQGYYSFTLHKDGIPKTTKTHQLVAIAFLNHIPDGYNKVIDHIDRNRLNNKVSNLRIVNMRENGNKDHIKSTSKYTGVHYKSRDNKWYSSITVNNKYIHLGVFNSEEEAHKYYQRALYSINNDLPIQRKVKQKTSKHKGVWFNKKNNNWNCGCKIDGKYKHIGVYKTEHEAHLAYQNKSKEKS